MIRSSDSQAKAFREPDTGSHARKPKRESDMASAVCVYLHAAGYEVRSELMQTDITAIHKDDVGIAREAHDVWSKTKRWKTTPLRMIGIEMKLSFNVDLIAQAVRAKRMFGNAIVVIPEPLTTKGKINTKTVDKATDICKALGVSLFFFCADGNLRIVGNLAVELTSTHYTKAIIREFLGRTSDRNTGGTCGVKLVTAYAESVYKITSFLMSAGVANVRDITKITNVPNARSIIASNYGKFFDFVEKDGKRNGYYCLTDKGNAHALLANVELPKMGCSVDWPVHHALDVWKDAYSRKISAAKAIQKNALFIASGGMHKVA